MTAKSNSPESFAKELDEFKKALKLSGVTGALRYLNQRTPHRYTGIYRYDGDTLRNEAFYDKYDPELQKGEDAPMATTYCSLLQSQNTLEIADAAADERVKGKITTPVVSYCGVSVKDSAGNSFGTLCHFDMKACQERTTDFLFLESAAKLLFQHLSAKSVSGK